MSEHIALIVPKSERDMRFSEHRSDLGHSTALVGNGLTAAAQEESLTEGLDAETGERVAKLSALASSDWRVYAAPKSRRSKGSSIRFGIG